MQGSRSRNHERSSHGSNGREMLEYLELPLRRPWHVVVPFVLLTAAAVGASYVLPARYRSSTLILVEAEKMPESFVTNVATERIGRKLQTVKQEILSRTRLEAIVREQDPYGGKASLTEMVDWVRASTQVSIRGNDAFGLEFVHHDPHVAQKVCDRMARLFIDETVQSRKQQVDEAHAFIESELEEARRQLEEREQTLRLYKEKHMGTLPEQLNANLQTLQRLQLEQQAISESLRAATDRVGNLEGTAARPPAANDARNEMLQLKSQLASLRTRYTDEHPDVQAVIGRIGVLERTVGTNGSVGGAAEGALEAARAEVKSLQARRTDLDAKIGSFQARVEHAPRTEQEIVTLTRDFQKLNENYLALLKKKLDTQLATKLEQRWQGDRFRILDPANLPEAPFYPNRLLFLLLGCAGGLAVGIAAALLADVLDNSIRNVRELEDALPFPVLANVPPVVPLHASEVRRASRRRPSDHTPRPGSKPAAGGVAIFDRAEREAGARKRGQ
jgi:polysaccharide biosynthesis transport protein